MSNKQRMAWAALVAIIAIGVAAVSGLAQESGVAESALWALAGIAMSVAAPGVLEAFAKLRGKR